MAQTHYPIAPPGPGAAPGVVMLGLDASNNPAPFSDAIPLRVQNFATTRKGFIIGQTQIALAATPTDFLELGGPATKTINIRKLLIQAQADTALSMRLVVQRRSAADAAGGVVITPAALDASGPNPTMSARYFNANPGTLGGGVSAFQRRLPFMLPASAPSPLVMDFSELDMPPLQLKGVLDFLCFNLLGAALPGANSTVDFYALVTEE